MFGRRCESMKGVTMNEKESTTMTILRNILLVATVMFLISCHTSCKHELRHTSILNVTVDGRKIHAVIDDAASIQPEADKAIIQIADIGVVTVLRDRLLLDGVELGKLPGAATNVEMVVKAGRMTVSADGKSVITKQLGK